MLNSPCANNILNDLIQQYYLHHKMNFLQLLASGASFLNFNFQSKSSLSVDSIPKGVEKPEGFKKVDNHVQNDSFNPLQSQIPTDQSNLLNHMLYNERQQLINRYLQLNLQLLKGKIPKEQSQPKPVNPQIFKEEISEKEELQHQDKSSNSKKKIKKPVKCGHDDKAHYAKGLCNNCYHKYGRTKKPWNCTHEKLYAGGMCQNCYINMYNKKKREQHQPFDQKQDFSDQGKENVIILMQQKQEIKQETLVEEVKEQ